jgi:acyl-coenzyme A thioesterase PaaI-like protein
MPATTDNRYSAYRQLRRDTHPGCVVCCRSNGQGLGLEFHIAHDGAVEASFSCGRVFQGYPDVLHGGVISMLLDGAMTNCLFAHNIVAVTADLAVRFRHPVATTNVALVRAWINSSTGPLHYLTAELMQNSEVKATATGKFLDKSFGGLFGKTV